MCIVHVVFHFGPSELFKVDVLGPVFPQQINLPLI